MTRILKIRLVDDGQYVDFADKLVLFKMRHSTGSLIYNTAEISEEDTSIAIVKLSNSALSVAGKSDCEIQVCDGATSQVLSSMTFIIQIRAGVFTDEELLSIAKNEFTALVDAILLAYKLQDEFMEILERLQFMTDEDVTSIINGTFVV